MSKQQQINKITQDFLEKLNISGNIEVTQHEEGFAVSIETQEAGILIGFHGDTLKSLELILTIIVSQKLGEFTRLSLDIGGYRKQREEQLIELARGIREKVLNDGQPLPILNLTPGERRTVHLLFQDDKAVTTESQGEGESRQLIIKPR